MNSLNKLIVYLNITAFILVSLEKSTFVTASAFHSSYSHNRRKCGSLQYINDNKCRKNIRAAEGSENSNKTCEDFVSASIEESPVSQLKGQQYFNNVSSIISLETNRKCLTILCDDVDLMGYCAYFTPGSSTTESEFHNTLQQQSHFVSVQCTCRNNITEDEEVKDEHFDRNYVGVVYSPYDKYWEPTGPNGALKRISWQNYSETEIQDTLIKIATKFSYVATYGMGTATNTSEWYEGDKIAFVPVLASEVNAEYGYPILRVSIGIFRKDDVYLRWNDKELYNAIDAAKVANERFNGSVWGITVTSEYVSDSTKARDAIDMIKLVKKMNQEQLLHLKVGIRLGTCTEFIANRRPEDDSGSPTYIQVTEDTTPPLTSFQASLHDIAKISDYILCVMFPDAKYAQSSMSYILNVMQTQFIHLRKTLQGINPNLKLVIETGVPSDGIGNGFRNTKGMLRTYWHSMAEFARKEQIMFHMHEAVDQPWKNIQDAAARNDNNGPNGTGAHYGWWQRKDNSEPPIYNEKSEDGSNTPNWFSKLPLITKILLLSFCVFVLFTFGSIAYLWWKLRKAKKQVISTAYIEQFHAGGDDCNNGDGNYAVALRIPYNREYELSKDNFHIDKGAVVGSGQCGVVVQGTVKGKPVAFKCTTPNSTVVDIKSIMSEIKILSYIGKHDNLVCILGAYTRKIQRGIVYIALEYCPLGNLEKFLRQVDSKKVFKCEKKVDDEDENSLKYVTIGDDGNYLSAINPGYISSLEEGLGLPYLSIEAAIQPSYLSAGQLDLIQDIPITSKPPYPDTAEFQVDISTFLRWAHQIASAMEFVSNKNVIHADLAARNILLASIDQVKVSDFGLSRKVYQDVGVIHDKDTPLPWRWMAPESLKHLVFSSETDVWAFAVTIWEIFSLAEVPYHGISYDMQFVSSLGKGMRLPRAKLASPTIHEQLIKCWDDSPNNRPTFGELKDFFLKLLQMNG